MIKFISLLLCLLAYSQSYVNNFKPKLLRKPSLTRSDSDTNQFSASAINSTTILDKNAIKKRVDKKFFDIALPAFIGLAADPIVSLIDATYVGQLGHIAQAGMGIAISAQYSVSKLYNDPLLKTSTSLVAGSFLISDLIIFYYFFITGKQGEELSANVATAISSAVLIGIIQSLIFLFFTNIS